MSDQIANPGRRRFLAAATGTVGLAGAAAGAVPFVQSMMPANDTLAHSTTEVDISKLEPGQLIVVPWRGTPVFILRRTPDILKRIETETVDLRDPDNLDPEGGKIPGWFRNADRRMRTFRARRREWYISSAICTHLGCVPLLREAPGLPELGKDWPGGFWCPCHGSRYDLSGRVLSGYPAPRNLEIMAYKFLSDTRILIG